MREVKLYGHLAKFGKSFQLDVQSVAEAIRALCALLPGFEQHVRKHSAPGYRVLVGKRLGVSEEELPMHSTGDIQLVPVVRGSGGKWGQVILGAALIAVAWWNPMGWTASGAFLSQATLYGMGASMLLGGISQMLVKQPNLNMRERPEAKASYTSDGPVNTTAQNNPAALIYGEVFTGSQVVSASVLTEEMAV